jgi:hypothetical protein
MGFLLCHLFDRVIGLAAGPKVNPLCFANDTVK